MVAGGGLAQLTESGGERDKPHRSFAVSVLTSRFSPVETHLEPWRSKSELKLKAFETKQT